MNPFLYWAAKEYPKAFRDITKGNNFKYVGNFTQCKLGYYAAPGWDPVTGLGMPVMRHLQRAAVEYVKLQAKASAVKKHA